ncbi:MAG: polysaccharide deacetylase family protein, partial [Christensenellaceae bacterium]|nr:polysaccharide deacetylase family protein [Christensenellaceae bacterium]
MRRSFCVILALVLLLVLLPLPTARAGVKVTASTGSVSFPLLYKDGTYYGYVPKRMEKVYITINKTKHTVALSSSSQATKFTLQNRPGGTVFSFKITRSKVDDTLTKGYLKQQVVAIKDTNIYAGPSTSFKKLKPLKKGTGLKVHYANYYNNWHRVTLADGTSGYVNDTKVDLIQVTKKPGKKYVALTFDDGPHKTNTVKVLNALKKYKAHATFFVVGNRLAGKEDICKKIVAQGSQIANHSYDHRSFGSLSQVNATANLNKCASAIKKATGITAYTARIPGGTDGSRITAAAKAGGYTLFKWNVNTLDWQHHSVSRTVSAATKVKDGDIVLMHDLHASTANSVESICKKLKAAGFEMVTVAELMTLKG